MPVSAARNSMFELGRAARLEGAQRSKCPYPAGMSQAEGWLAGWDSLGPDGGGSRSGSLDRMSYRHMPRDQELALLNLARSGSSLGALARRFDRTVAEIRARLSAARIDCPKSGPSQSGTPWSQGETDMLHELWNAGYDIPNLADALGRLAEEVESQLSTVVTRPWSNEEYLALQSYKQNGISIEDIAVIINRSTLDIEVKCSDFVHSRWCLTSNTKVA